MAAVLLNVTPFRHLMTVVPTLAYQLRSALLVSVPTHFSQDAYTGLKLQFSVKRHGFLAMRLQPL
jgi:hypothetical protein